jgi:hypothetical protein
MTKDRGRGLAGKGLDAAAELTNGARMVRVLTVDVLRNGHATRSSCGGVPPFLVHLHTFKTSVLFGK